MTAPEPSQPKVLRVYVTSDEGEDLSELLMSMLAQVLENQSTIMEKVDRLELGFETLRKDGI